MSDVAGWYRQYLGREPDPGGLANWQQQVVTHGHDDALSRFRNEPEALRYAGGSSSSSSGSSSSSSGSSFLSGLAGMGAFNEDMMKEMWDYYKSDQRPYEQEMLWSQRLLLPTQTAATQAGMDLQLSNAASAMDLQPYLHAFNMDKVGYDTERIGLQHQLDAGRLQSAHEMTPYMHALGLEKIEQERYLMPHVTNTRVGQMDAIAQLRAEAAKGIDIERRVGQAGADAQAIADAQKQASQRDLTRMGINPASGRYAGMQRDAEISTAGNKLGAMNQARWTGETEDWNRRAHVAQGFGI